MSHLSQTSLHDVFNQFLYAATCLRLVEIVTERIEDEGKRFPTLRAFGSSVSAWLQVEFLFRCFCCSTVIVKVENVPITVNTWEECKYCIAICPCYGLLVGTVVDSCRD